MPRLWTMQEAKSKMGRIVRNAFEEGPQILTRNGRIQAVVLSIDDYRKLRHKQSPLSSLHTRMMRFERDHDDHEDGLTKND